MPTETRWLKAVVLQITQVDVHLRVSPWGENEVDDVERREDNHHEQHTVDGEIPMEVPQINITLGIADIRKVLPWILIEKTDNFKDDELEHCAGESEVYTKYQLNYNRKLCFVFMIYLQMFLDWNYLAYDEVHSL